MPKYVYEALDEQGQPVRTFEVWQGINDPALTTDPESGAKVRRIIAGTAVIGLGGSTAGGSRSGGAAPRPAQSCGSGCKCH